MNELLFRFTLNNTIEGSHSIKEPDGWKDATLKLERDKEYHSLVEFYDQVFISYGGPSEKYDGGYDYILNVLETQGPDADISILTELSEDGGNTWETLNNGIIDLSSIREIDFLTIQYGIVRDSFWTRFWNQRTTSINIQANNDIYGDARPVIAPIALTLTGQVVPMAYEGHGDISNTITYVIPNGQYGQLDMSTDEIKEIEDKFTIPRVVNSVKPGGLFLFKYGGEVTLNMEFYFYQGSFIGSSGLDPNINIQIQINDNAPTTISRVNQTSGIDTWTLFSYLAGTFTVNAKDSLKIYIINSSGSTQTINWYANTIHNTFLTINQNSIYEDTTIDAMKLHEAGQSILDRIIGQDDSLYSKYLGNPDTERVVYEDSGCFSYSSIQKGLHIKGFTFVEKPFSISFNDFWNGINPIFNLGLGYEGTGINNGDFIGSLSPATNESTGNSWVWNANKARVIIPNSFSGTKWLRIPCSTIIGVPYTVTLNFDVIDGGNGPGNYTRIIVYLTDGLDFTDNYDANNLPLGNGQTINATITPTQDRPYIVIIGFSNNNPGGFARIIDLDLVSIDPIPDKQIIRIEPKEYFYDPTIVLYLDYVNKIDHSINTENIYKNIKIGYEKWESETLSGLDEVQTKHEYAVPLRKIGEDIELYSKFIAAALAHENTRRKGTEREKDWRLDDNVFITQILKDGSDYLPFNNVNVGGTYPAAANILSGETRYNLYVTPKRNFLRWRNFFNGGVQFNSDYLSQDGEGNTLAITDDGNLGDCPLGFIDESTDISITNDYLFGIDVYQFEHPLTWTQYKILRDNRTKAIGVSTTNSGHEAFFILSLEWSPVTPKGIFKLIKA